MWQVAVSASMRGKRLAGQLIEALLDRSEQSGVTHITSTITKDNRASWALFESLARKWDAPLEQHTRFECETHFAGKHASEWQVTIGPLPHQARPHNKES